MVSHSFVVFHRKDCFETISSNEIDFFKSLFKPLLLKKNYSRFTKCTSATLSSTHKMSQLLKALGRL